MRSGQLILSIIMQISTSTYLQGNLNLDTVRNIKSKNTEQVSAKAEVPNAKVSISDNALEKLAQEQQALGKKLGEQLTSTASESSEDKAVSDESELEKIDKLIEKIKEQIEQKQREINALNNDKSEQAEEQRKLLSSELTALNGTLISLIGKKLELLEQE
ncbi:hypothetical protein [Thalassotalea sediminis]|uniref:hypothetical protein n=1 Tax=Thalassotalea sediminis TaxID=1759089 RepID=UPI002572D2ED|nr:hypothetical protein [Thalassotalea sediminis]